MHVLMSHGNYMNLFNGTNFQIITVRFPRKEGVPPKSTTPEIKQTITTIIRVPKSTTG